MKTALEQCFSFQFCHHRQAPSHRRPNLSPTPPHLPASQRLLCLQCRKRQALNWQRRLQANAAEGAKAAQRLHVGGMVLTVERGMPRHGRIPGHSFCCRQCAPQLLPRPWIT